VILQNEIESKVQLANDALQTAAESLQYKPPKIYSLPFIWSYFTPIFAVTAAYIIKLQAATAIPWFPFIIMCGFGVRLLIAPLMIRQMILINKIGQASPNIRVSAKLFKYSKQSLFARLRHTASAIYLLAFYFYNLIQIPVFIVMVLSIRKISFENDDLIGTGILWF
jgi:membrane protein insertase Oxa1/YidC/SpoIIIJ